MARCYYLMDDSSIVLVDEHEAGYYDTRLIPKGDSFDELMDFVEALNKQEFGIDDDEVNRILAKSMFQKS